MPRRTGRGGKGPFMDKTLRQDAGAIIAAALSAAMPDEAVRRALKDLPPCRGKLVLIAVGKAAWQMASAALEALDGRVDGGAVITKYGHARGALPPPESRNNTRSSAPSGATRSMAACVAAKEFSSGTGWPASYT